LRCAQSRVRDIAWMVFRGVELEPGIDALPLRIGVLQG